MPAPIASLKTFAQRLRERLVGLCGSRRARRFALIAAAVLAVYALLGFFAVPALLRHYVDTRAAALLGRPVSVESLAFNPFTLRLGADRLHVGEVDGRTSFVDIERLTLSASWSSLFRLAPVLDEVVVQRPRIAITRTAAQRFNFSDLIERFSVPQTTVPADAKPARFSLSNIAVHAGEIRFDDHVENASHRFEQIEIGIPFLANLPRDVDIYVQPLLALTIDGSPLRIDGQTKPFADSLESTIDFHLDRLDLPRYLGYVPAELPFAIPRGRLSGDLQLRFVQDKAAPQLRLGGTLALDDFALTARDAAPIAEVGRASAALTDVQPLLARYQFGDVRIERAALRYARKAEGRSNVDSLMGGTKPAQGPTPANEVAIARLTLVACRFDYIDETRSAETRGDAPATITIGDIAGAVSGLDTRNGPPARVEVTATHNGGKLATKGELDLPASRYAGTLEAKDVGLPPLQPFALPAGSRALIQQGRFATAGRFQADWKGAFNLHIEPAAATISDFAIGWRDGKETLIAWNALDIGLARFDLATQEAQHGDVVLHGLRIKAQRGRDGRIDLASLAESGSAAKNAPAAKAAPWRWSVARFALDDGSVQLRDRSTPKSGELAIRSIQGEVSGLSEDLKRPLKLALGAAIERGRFDLSGKVRPEPLDADFRIKTRELDLAGPSAYIAAPFNLRVTSALLTSDGNARYADGKPARITYRGRVALDRVRVQGLPTNADFVNFRRLSIGAIDYAQHMGPMQLKLGDIALDDFHARVVLDKDGKLNLSDIAGGGTAAPVAVTQAQEAARAVPNPPASALESAEPAAPAEPAAKIDVGQITLSRGRLHFTDNFIRPNYTANITDLDGRIGAFGTSGGAPAAIALQGRLDDHAEVDIDGSINPLAPSAFVDIKGKAHGVELTHLSAYSGKYTGYPIVKGRLNADVAYLLEQGRLTADNHIVIDQLSFGDKIEGPGVSHLPVKLAVALLKDADGVIDVNVPVSGSLDDPQFSLGGVIWRAFAGLIAKAATAPFRLLGAMFSGGEGGDQDLSHVEFVPGSAALDAEAKTRLDKITTAMSKRPAVNLDIGGRIDPALDEPGLRRVMVDDLIRREYLDDHDDTNSANKGGTPGEDEAAALPPLSPEDTEKYLGAAYKHADFPKEKTLVFVTKSQPAEKMRKLLEEHMQVDENALHQLADRRASAVRAYLKSRIDDRRVFVVAPKYDTKGIDDGGKTTRAEFGLH